MLSKNQPTKPSTGNKKTTAPATLRGFDINLVPEDQRKSQILVNSKGSKLLISALLGLLFVVLSYGGLFYYKIQANQNIALIQNELVSVKSQITAIETKRDELVKFQDKMVVIKDVLDNHIYWSNFFDNLEKNTLSDVVYTTLVSANREKVTLTVLAKNYEMAAKQIVAMQQAKDFVADVSVNSANTALSAMGTPMGVNFDLNLTLKDKIFKK